MWRKWRQTKTIEWNCSQKCSENYLFFSVFRLSHSIANGKHVIPFRTFVLRPRSRSSSTFEKTNVVRFVRKTVFDEVVDGALMTTQKSKEEESTIKSISQQNKLRVLLKNVRGHHRPYTFDAFNYCRSIGARTTLEHFVYAMKSFDRFLTLIRTRKQNRKKKIINLIKTIEGCSELRDKSSQLAWRWFVHLCACFLVILFRCAFVDAGQLKNRLNARKQFLFVLPIFQSVHQLFLIMLFCANQRDKRISIMFSCVGHQQTKIHFAMSCVDKYRSD